MAYNFPTLSLDAEDPDLRVMALYDLKRKIESHTFFHNQSADHSVARLCTALYDPSEEVRSNAIPILGYVLPACTHQAVLEVLFENIQPAAALEKLDVATLSQVYRTILLSVQKLVREGTISAKQRPRYEDVVNRSFLPHLLSDVYNFGSADAEKKPDERTSAAVDLLVLAIQIGGNRLPQSELYLLNATLWKHVLSPARDLTLRSYCVKGASALLGVAMDRIYLERVRDIVEMISGFDKRQPGQYVVLKDCFNILKNAAVSQPQRFFDFAHLMPAAMSKTLDWTLITGDESEELLELAVNLQDAALAFYDMLFWVYPEVMRENTKTAVLTGLEFLKVDPGYIDVADPDNDVPLFEEDDEFEEDQGFGDMDNSSWRLRLAGAKLIETLSHTEREAIKNLEVAETVRLSLLSLLKDRYNDVVVRAAAALAVYLEAEAKHHQEPTNIAGSKRRRGSSGEANKRADLQFYSTLQALLLKLFMSDSWVVRTAAIDLLRSATAGQEEACWETWREVALHLLSLLEKHKGIALRSNGSYVAHALSALERLIANFGAKKFEPLIPQIVSLVSGLLDDDSSIIVTATLQFLSSFNTYYNATHLSSLPTPSPFESLVNATFRPTQSAAVRDVGLEVLNEFIESGYKEVINSGDDVFMSAWDHVTSNQRSLNAFRTMELLWTPALAKDDSLRSAVLKFASEKLADESMALRMACVGIVKMVASCLPESEEAEQDVDTIQLTLLPLLEQVEDTVLLRVSLEIANALPPKHVARFLSSNDIRARIVQAVFVGTANEQHIAPLMALCSSLDIEARKVVDSLIEELDAKEKNSETDFHTAIPLAAKAAANLMVKPKNRQVPLEVTERSERFVRAILEEIPASTTPSWRIAFNFVLLCEMAIINDSLTEGFVTSSVIFSWLHPMGLPSDFLTIVAIALGRLAIHQPDTHIPSVLDRLLGERGSDDYSIVVHALFSYLEDSRENIPYLGDIWEAVLGVFPTIPHKQVALRCLGRVAVHDMKFLNIARHEFASSSDVEKRKTSAFVLEHWLLDVGTIASLTMSTTDGNSIWSLHRKIVEENVLRLVNDGEIEVRENAMLALNGIAFKYPEAVHPLTEPILKVALSMIEMDNSLVSEVKVGPFTRRIDRGLTSRKSAYEILHTLIDFDHPSLNIVEVFDRCVRALKEDDEVRNQISLILARIIERVFGESSANLVTGNCERSASTNLEIATHSRISVGKLEKGASTHRKILVNQRVNPYRPFTLVEKQLLDKERSAALCDALTCILKTELGPKTSKAEQTALRADKIAVLRVFWEMYTALAKFIRVDAIPVIPEVGTGRKVWGEDDEEVDVSEAYASPLKHLESFWEEVGTSFPDLTAAVEAANQE